jgi:alpha-beta hydrolase superfamily lysophospholipase
MTQFIDNPQINTLLFGCKRDGFSKQSKTAQTLQFQDSSGNTILAQLYTHSPESANIIFFPSTETPLVQYEEMAASYIAHGMNILVLSYRADYKTDTVPKMSEFYADGRVLFEQSIAWLDNNGFSGAKFILGQSLGSVLAIDVASHTPEPIKGMLLESAMCQTTDYLNKRGLSTENINNVEELGFCNLEKIEKIKLATLIFHGAKDEFIPITDAEKLQASSGARTKQFFIIPGAQHSSLHASGGKLYFETIKNFIDTLCGVNTWRQKRKKYNEAREK